jgi:hypothetical protein
VHSGLCWRASATRCQGRPEAARAFENFALLPPTPYAPPARPPTASTGVGPSAPTTSVGRPQRASRPCCCRRPSLSSRPDPRALMVGPCDVWPRKPRPLSMAKIVRPTFRACDRGDCCDCSARTRQESLRREGRGGGGTEGSGPGTRESRRPLSFATTLTVRISLAKSFVELGSDGRQGIRITRSGDGGGDGGDY